MKVSSRLNNRGHSYDYTRGWQHATYVYHKGRDQATYVYITSRAGGGAVCSLEASLELAPDIHKSPYATDSTKDRIF